MMYIYVTRQGRLAPTAYSSVNYRMALHIPMYEAATAKLWTELCSVSTGALLHRALEPTSMLALARRVGVPDTSI